ncbi:hypothetical protein HETIRDRAFT_388291 [Heterobasidion irregulare TC 32-1]|uniref:Alcohol dehydrogenase-like N-terminal domain-containing protein n=1 Tax=Heterobasidion irregulare (strain TC 32-1) TaxID=747525 RepID=W4JXA8_HETIT|nr:uncharacterized protein HETIRDRAFT_388291 [Heterobasidion irregulare TC 32-1]ETW78183.1 hypothetical protein HETIRDRAFT_388291 [Heterobasidion irregulare TC 32-1]
MSTTIPETQLAVRWYPASFDVRLENVPTPMIEHPDDAIVKITFAGLCGSDLHVYRGLEDVHEIHICGHEFIGHVVALGSSFSPLSPPSRPELYATLQVGDKIVSPFTTSCGECSPCRRGFTARCTSSFLFGTPVLPGGQAQYTRVPKAGGTLFVLPSSISPNASAPFLDVATFMALPDPTLLLLADILPTGLFVALQALSHPKLSPFTANTSWPNTMDGILYSHISTSAAPLMEDDRVLTIGVVGLGPVGLCAILALLDLLEHRQLPTRFRIVASDLNKSRRAKMQNMYNALPAPSKGPVGSEFIVCGVESLPTWARHGCHAVLEVVGTPPALTLALSLLAPSGVLSSCGVHQAPPIPFTGRELYNLNVTLEFGRCSVRALFGAAAGLLARRRDVLGVVGEAGVVERVVSLRDAVSAYEMFEQGRCGKVVFDAWA